MSLGALDTSKFKAPLRAKSRSFGDRNIIFGKQAQCDKVKQKKHIFENFCI